MSLKVLALQEAGSPHILRITTHWGSAIGNFQIRKKGGNQTISISFSPAVNMQMINQAWEAAGGRWLQRYLKKVAKEGPFEALRILFLYDHNPAKGQTKGPTIAWYLFHESECPADILMEFHDFTLQEIAAFFGFTEADIYVEPKDK